MKNKTANQIIDEMNLDDEVKRISKESLDWYRNNIYECPIDILRVLYGELLQENEELKNMDLTTVYLKGVADEKERWRNKVKKFIKENSYTDTYNFKTVEVSKLQELLGE